MPPNLTARGSDMSSRIIAPTDCCFSVGSSPKCCPLCKSDHRIVREEPWVSGPTWHGQTRLVDCPRCGWWSLDRNGSTYAPEKTIFSNSRTFSIVSEFGVADLSLPIGLLRQHLRARFDDIYDIHPSKLEELVGDMFREHGYRVEPTAYSKDGGIDLWLFRDPGDRPIAVQAKRYRADHKIGVELVRQFIGALVASKTDSGIFVTTSRYTEGARLVPTLPGVIAKGIGLELLDVDRIDDFVTAGAPNLGDPLEAAWSLRERLPEETDMYGGWMLTGDEWPRIPPAGIHVEWWIDAFRARVRDPSLMRDPPGRPRTLSKDELLAAVARLKPGMIVEVTSVSPAGEFDCGRFLAQRIRGTSIQYCRWEKPLHLKPGNTVDVREWHPIAGHYAFEAGLAGRGYGQARIQGWRPPEPVFL